MTDKPCTPEQRAAIMPWFIAYLVFFALPLPVYGALLAWHLWTGQGDIWLHLTVMALLEGVRRIARHWLSRRIDQIMNQIPGTPARTDSPGNSPGS